MAIEAKKSSPDRGNGTGNGEVVISVKDLWKVFGRDPMQALAQENLRLGKKELQENLGLVVGLQEVTFDVRKGETFVVMGLSGSGKSTLVRCLNRLIDPTAGEIYIDGEDILQADHQRLTEFRRNKVAMVFQHYGLLPHRNVVDNASWGLEVRGIERTERYSKTQEMLDLVGLNGWESSYPRQLSGGMQQRVGLARALATEPVILLMDEPFSGLDPLIRRNMQDELIRIQQGLHRTMVFITHDLAEAVKIGDRIAIMRDGVIVQIGAPEDIVLNPENDYVAEFTQDVRRESILTANHIMADPCTIVPSHKGPEEALQAMRADESEVALVMGEDDTYLGILTMERAHSAIQAGVGKLHDGIEDYIYTDLDPVPHDSALERIIPICMTCEYPVPVADESGKVIGVVDRQTLAQAITGGQ
ncbi:MAG: glycine betaine/L-proline ABC transporter ATP-binding protein [Dehalococcoidia bacterium]|nr:glycine betaine/L-proline ABC transporter ATP-binding protein [Dehalococcoidia bacterium]